MKFLPWPGSLYVKGTTIGESWYAASSSAKYSAWVAGLCEYSLSIWIALRALKSVWNAHRLIKLTNYWSAIRYLVGGSNVYNALNIILPCSPPVRGISTRGSSDLRSRPVGNSSGRSLGIDVLEIMRTEARKKCPRNSQDLGEPWVNYLIFSNRRLTRP
jgi:hypothetical protein